jgi:hypothetical protein
MAALSSIAGALSVRHGIVTEDLTFSRLGGPQRKQPVPILINSIARAGEQRYDLGKPGSGGHGNAELRQ